MSAGGLAESRRWRIRAHGGRPLTVNQVASMDRFTWAKHTKMIRELWWALARQACIPRLDRVRFRVIPLHRNGRSPQDPAACAPEAKAAIDGLVDARVIPDDTGRFVAAVEFMPPEVCGVDGLAIEITEEP